MRSKTSLELAHETLNVLGHYRATRDVVDLELAAVLTAILTKSIEEDLVNHDLRSVPNKTTIKAMQDADTGKTEKFVSIEDTLKNLDS